MKELLLSIAVRPTVAKLWSKYSSGNVSIFVFHRCTADNTMEGCLQLDKLDELLGKLHEHGIVVDTLVNTINAVRSGSNLQPRVVFTIDDGYSCFKEAAKVFEKHNATATIFLTTGFLSHDCWMWWDKVSYIVGSAKFPNAELNIFTGDRTVTFDAQSTQLCSEICELLKTLPDAVKDKAIDQLANDNSVVLPKKAPESCQALTWDEVRDLQRRGFEFAPHSVSHPILANVSDEESKRQITESYIALQAQVPAAPVFAYPNGDSGDFGGREKVVLQELGMLAAVSTRPDYVSPEMLMADSSHLYQLPRFYWTNNVNKLLAVATGLKNVYSRFTSPSLRASSHVRTTRNLKQN